MENEENEFVKPEDVPKDAKTIDTLNDEMLDGAYNIVKGISALFDLPIDKRMEILNNFDAMRRLDRERLEAIVMYVMATRSKKFADIYCCFEDMLRYIDAIIKGEEK